MRSFQDSVVVVTGAGSGIGRAAALTFSRARARVVLADIDDVRLQSVYGEIVREGGSARTYKVDVADPGEVASFTKAVLAEFGKADIVVNSAGVLILGETRLVTLGEFRRLMEVNFWGLIHLFNGFLPSMIEREKGHFVNISSANGLFPLPLVGPYNASKSAVLAISETLRFEVARFGIGVTTICPGLTASRIREDAIVRTDSEPSRKFMEFCLDRMRRREGNAFIVAKKIPPAVARNRAVVLISAETRFLALLYRYWPGLFRLATATVLRKKRL